MTTISRKPVFAVVLAAGSASRFGGTKQLEHVGGTPLVRRAAELARETCGDHSVLVTGHENFAVAAAAGDAAQFLIVNERYADGMGISIAVAARALAHAARAILILLADQPLVTAGHLRAMLGSWSGADDEIVATSFANTEGPPVLFPSASFDALGQLSGDRGARDVMRDPRFSLRKVRFQDAAIDIDTPADLESLP